MKALLLAAALALPAAGCAARDPAPPAVPAPSGAQAQACVGPVTGSPAMPVRVMRRTERQYWPQPVRVRGTA